jgi:hypothetical protein
MTSLAVVALAPFAIVLWPVVFVVQVLLLVGLTPFIAFGTEMRALLRHVWHASGPLADDRG